MVDSIERGMCTIERGGGDRREAKDTIEMG